MTKLNSAQQAAVDHGEGPALVVAGAGTGKTRVIVERIARLIEEGVDKQAILALTFTEKAAQEMRDRVAEELEGSYGAELSIYTFNAFGQEMLREFAVEIGLSPNMRLLGDTGKVVLLREHLDDLGLDYFSPVSQPDSQLYAISDYFSLLKQQVVTAERYAEFAKKLPNTSEEETLEKQRHTELATAFEAYLSICRNVGAIDYDDQLYLLIELLEKRPNIAAKLHERFAYILVDEFQDTNPMQSQVLDLLAQKHKNIMVVGDDDQSIYGWRGATLANILSFSERYPDTKQITLTDNYRSTQDVLDASYALIQNNNPVRLEAMNNLDKRLQAQVETVGETSVKSFTTLDAEIDWVASDIARRIAGGEEPGSIAVLTRRNATAKKTSEVLSYQGIDHQLVGMRKDLYQEPIIGTMVEALSAAIDPTESSALYHTLSGPLFDVDQTELSGASASAQKQHIPLLATLESQSLFTNELKQLKKWHEMHSVQSVASLAYAMLDESGLKDTLYVDAGSSETAARSVQTLGQWFESLRSFMDVSTLGTARQYLDDLPALRAAGETLNDSDDAFGSDIPVIMSVHKAKGLEWKTVYIVDCTENSFPLRASRSSLVLPDELMHATSADDHMAEERRLMYVAATRARNNLICSFSETHTGTTKRKPSRFLSELFGETLPDAAIDGTTQTSLDLFASPTDEGSYLPLPKHMLNDGVVTLSASQLNDYFRCPRDFYYRHVLQVPSEPNAASGIGTLFHSLIQSINESRMRGDAPPTLESLQARLSDEWPSEGFQSSSHRDRARTLAEKSLPELYDRITSTPVPVASEAPFRVHIPNSNVVIRGRIDAVLPGEKGVEIVDYKTSTSATTPEKAKKSASGSKQLDMYALAWLHTHGEAPEKVTLDFVQTGQHGSVKKRESTLHTLEEKIAKAGEAIQAQDFPLGYSHAYCRHPQEK